MRGFIVTDHADQFEAAAGYLAGLLADGRLKYDETVVEGFDQVPFAETADTAYPVPLQVDREDVRTVGREVMSNDNAAPRSSREVVAHAVLFHAD